MVLAHARALAWLVNKVEIRLAFEHWWDISRPPDCLQHTTGLGVKEVSGIAMTRCDIDTRISA
jgi:hypothetical protein